MSIRRQKSYGEMSRDERSVVFDYALNTLLMDVMDEIDLSRFNATIPKSVFKEILDLIRQGADPNTIAPRSGMTPLLVSFFYNDVFPLTQILRMGANPNLGTNEDYPTPITGAFRIGVTRLQNSADPQRVINNNLQQLKLLLEAGANPNIATSTGVYLMDNSFTPLLDEVADTLCSYRRSEPEVVSYILQVIQLLLNSGANPVV